MTARWRSSVATLAVALYVTTLCPPGRAQTPTFSTTLEAVRVDVLVTENGRPILGLRPSDFEVRDNGVRQQVEFATLERLPLNVMLALDTSQSVSGQRLEHLQTATEALLDGLITNDQAALITFNHLLGLRSPFTPDLARVRQAVRDVRPAGGTALVDAMFAGVTLGDAEPGRNLMVAFTDGADTSSYLPRHSVIEAARSGQTVVYVVAPTLRGSGTRKFLMDVTDETGGRFLEVQSSGDMQRAFASILYEFRLRYVLSFTPTSVSKGGWHKLDVRLKGRTGVVRARPGYQGGR